MNGRRFPFAVDLRPARGNTSCVIPVEIVEQSVLRAYPQTQAIYLFGSVAEDEDRPGSDVDIAVLLPHRVAHGVGSFARSDLRFDLETRLNRAVDLINLRSVSVVFKKEIIETGRLLFVADEPGVDEFEMLTISLYQQLNRERARILADVLETGQAYRT